MDVREFHARACDLQDLLRENGFPKADVTVWGTGRSRAGGVALHVYTNGMTKDPYRCFAGEPAEIVEKAGQYVEQTIREANRGERDVWLTLGLTADGSLPVFAEAAE